MRIIFCGTPNCAVPALELLSQLEYVEICKVVTMPDRPAGRGKHLTPPPIATFSNDHQLSLLQTSNINKETEFIQFIQDNNIDAIIVFAFAQFLGKSILCAPKLGCFNVHTSLLPKYRGAAPIQFALLNGDHETGVSIQKMVKKMDAGDLVLTKSIPIDPADNTLSLTQKLQNLALVLLKDLITQLQQNKLQYKPQNHDIATFAPTIQKELGKISFSELTFQEINNRCRALTPWPGIFCFINKKRLKIISIEESNLSLKPGCISTRYDMLTIGCKDSSIRLCSIQLEGKKVCCDKDFINGFRNMIPDIIS